MELYLGILLCTVSVLVCVWMFVRRRRGDEPFCRKCGFCLAGLTEPKVCPECGRGLDRKRAVVIGEARTKRRPVFVSLGLAIAGVLLVVVDGLGMRGVFPVVLYKPAWLLTAEAYLLGDRRASVATAEIHSRTTAGTLDASWQDRLVRISLDRHAQTWRAFPDAQWQVIVEAMGRNDLTFEQIERVWDDCFGEPVLIKPLSGNLRVYQGERVDFRAGVDTRAGRVVPNAMGDAGFVLVGEIAVHVERADIVSQSDDLPMLGRSHGIGLIVQRKRLTPGVPRSADVRWWAIVEIDRPAGVYDGYVDIQIRYAASMVAINWTNINTTLLDQLATLEHTYRLPFTLEVVAEGEDDFGPIQPLLLTRDPSSLIEFRVSRLWSAEENEGTPGVMYWVGTTEELDESIGLGGFVVFEQDGREVRSVATYSKPHSPTQNYIPLDGFEPGEIRVRYEYDAEQYRHVREHMTSPLGGPIELGTIELPGKK